MMVKQPLKQWGMSSIGLLIVLAIVGFVLMCLIKLGPLYVSDKMLGNSLENIRAQGIAEMTNSQIRSKVGRHFDIDNVTDIDVRDIEIKRDKSRVMLSLDYEKRVHFFGNVDVVLVFNHQVDSSERE